jgi:hypothetical protein
MNYFNNASHLQTNARFISDEETSIIVHSRELEDVSENILVQFIGEERTSQLKEICHREITVASGNNKWTIICETENEGKKIISSDKYSKPERSIARNREFKKVVQNIKTSDNIAFFINAEKTLNEMPKLYHGWKKEVPKYIKAFGGTIKKTAGKIQLKTFLSLAQTIKPNITRNYLDTSILRLKKEDASFFLAGNNIGEIIKDVIKKIEIENLPLAINLKNSIHEIQGELFLDELDFETASEMLEGQFLLQTNDQEKSVSYVSRNKELPVEKIIGAIQKKSRYMNPQKKYFTLPDRSTGAETITRGEADIIRSDKNEGVLTSINLRGTNKKPAILETSNQTIIASSEKEIIEISQEKSSERTLDGRYNLTFGIRNTENILSENDPLKKLLGFTRTITGGITFVKDGIFADLIIEL